MIRLNSIQEKFEGHIKQKLLFLSGALVISNIEKTKIKSKQKLQSFYHRYIDKVCSVKEKIFFFQIHSEWQQQET